MEPQKYESRKILPVSQGLSPAPEARLLDKTRLIAALTSAFGQHTALQLRYGAPETIAALLSGSTVRGQTSVQLSSAGIGGLTRLFFSDWKQGAPGSLPSPDGTGDANWGPSLFSRISESMFMAAVRSGTLVLPERANQQDVHEALVRYRQGLGLGELLAGMGFQVKLPVITCPANGRFSLGGISKSGNYFASRLELHASDSYPSNQGCFLPFLSNSWVDSARDEQGRTIYSQSLAEAAGLMANRPADAAGSDASGLLAVLKHSRELSLHEWLGSC